MIQKGKIKVIKKGMRSSSETAPAQKEMAPRTAAREMVSNVSTWVADLQARKSNEAKIAFDSLFNTLPTRSN
jgi:hypothetical protein